MHVLALHGGSDEVLALAETVASTLDEAGLQVLLDDRDERRARSSPTRILSAARSV